MTLEQFRDALASDAKTENEELKEKISKLEEEMKIKDEEVISLNELCDELRKEARQLGNRCFITTQGTMCVFCTSNNCPHKMTMEDMSAVAQFKKDNHLKDDSEETIEKVSEYVRQRKVAQFMAR